MRCGVATPRQGADLWTKDFGRSTLFRKEISLRLASRIRADMGHFASNLKKAPGGPAGSGSLFSPRDHRVAAPSRGDLASVRNMVPKRPTTKL